MGWGQALSLFLDLFAADMAQLLRKSVGCYLLICAPGFSSNFIMKMLLHQIQMMCQQKCKGPFLCVSGLGKGPPPAWDSVENAGLREWLCHHAGLNFADKPMLSFLFRMRNACEAVGSTRTENLFASALL